MSDDEDYDSEEDLDYVPSDGEKGSEESDSGEEEDFSALNDGDPIVKGTKQKRKAKPKNDFAPRKRKGGIKLEGKNEAQADEANGDEENVMLAQKIKEEEASRKEEKEKKRVDDLWSSFLSDVKSTAKPAPKPNASISAVKPNTTASSSNMPASPAGNDNSTATMSTPTSDTAAKPVNGKVTITQVFDFAGEEIKVTKEVDSESKEAKAEQKKAEQMKQEKETAAASSPSLKNATTAVSSLSGSSVTNSLIGEKRPAPGGGLGSVLSKIGKKTENGHLGKVKNGLGEFQEQGRHF